MDAEHTLRIEAAEVVKEVAFAVQHVQISEVLPSSDHLVFLNLQTKEDCVFCVELSVRGFRVVGHRFDEISTTQEDKYEKYFETIYALLDSVSPGYIKTFGDVLMNKLSQLQKLQEDSSTCS